MMKHFFAKAIVLALIFFGLGFMGSLFGPALLLVWLSAFGGIYALVRGLVWLWKTL